VKVVLLHCHLGYPFVMREARTSEPAEDLEAEGSLSNGAWKKDKIGFWCPADIDFAIQNLVDQGAYQDKSKACVDLIRKGLEKANAISPDLSERVEKLSKSLMRDPNVIISQCISGIFEMIDSDMNDVPIIIEEIRLRERRKKKVKKLNSANGD